MLSEYERAKMKLDAFRAEAALRRQVPVGLWRGRLAGVLRSAAERLEPPASVPAAAKTP